MFDRIIEYKGIDFEVTLDNYTIKIKAQNYPITASGIYLLDEPIMEYVYKILNEIDVVSIAERYEEFIGTL